MELELEKLLPVVTKTLYRISEEIDKQGIVDWKILAEFNKAINCRIRLEEVLGKQNENGDEGEELDDFARDGRFVRRLGLASI